MNYKFGELNDAPIEFGSSLGVKFSCDRGDLRNTVEVRVPLWVHENRTSEGLHKILTSSYFEFAYWHAINIHPVLNGFRGFDTIRFEQYLCDY